MTFSGQSGISLKPELAHEAAEKLKMSGVHVEQAILQLQSDLGNNIRWEGRAAVEYQVVQAKLNEAYEHFRQVVQMSSTTLTSATDRVVQVDQTPYFA